MPILNPLHSGSWSQIDPPRPGLWLNLIFMVDGPIFPGQNINTSWELWTFHETLRLGQITATIFVIDEKGMERPLSSKQIEYDVKGLFGTGVQKDTFLANQIDQSLLQFLYRIGTKTIHLRLTGNGPDRGPYTAEADLVVQAEAVDETCWVWTGVFTGNHTNFAKWNRDYPEQLQQDGSLLQALQGNLNNNFHAKMVSMVTLFEQEQRSLLHPQAFPVRDLPPPQSRDIDAGAETVNDAAATQVVVFPTDQIKQKWQWLQDGTWAITGPIRKDFKYWVQFTLNDHFGNVYGPFRSPEINVQISVGDDKIAEGVLALHEQNHAIFDAIVATLPFCQWAATGAAQNQVLALIAANLAKDPPEANLRFREQVQVEPVTLPATFEASPALSTFRPLFDKTNRILATCQALSEIESRLLGARLAGDQDAASMQESSYRAFVDQMAADAAALPSEMPDMETLVDPAAFQRTLAGFRESGIPADAQSQLRDAGVPEDLLLQMDEAVRTPAIADLLAEGPTLILGRVVNSLGNLVQFIKQGMTVTLSAGVPGPPSIAPTPYIACATNAQGDLHICAIDARRGLWHTIRRADGSWPRPFGDVQAETSKAGPSIGPTPYVACATNAEGDLDICAIDAQGGLWHTIRRADGSWPQAFGDVQAETTKVGPSIGPTPYVTCATNAQGDLHICAVDARGRLWHTIRRADGTWPFAFGDIGAAVGGLP